MPASRLERRCTGFSRMRVFSSFWSPSGAGGCTREGLSPLLDRDDPDLPRARDRARIPGLPEQGRGFNANSSCRVVIERRLQEPIVQAHMGLPLSERTEKSFGSDGTANCTDRARYSGNALFLNLSIHAQKMAGLFGEAGINIRQSTPFSLGLLKSGTNTNGKHRPLIFSHVLRSLDKENILCYYLDG
jgi:hypothetical protein